MKLGLISAGNGHLLSKALVQKKNQAVQKLMVEWVKEAQNYGCERILISTEAIIHQFASVKNIHLLERAAAKAGIQQVKALGFFRDLLSHALSTYKHRATSGAFPDYAEWLENHYETPDVLGEFLNTHLESEIEWTFRKFKKNSDHLINSFFNTWLNLPLNSLPKKNKVNESLTLSEISLISEVAMQSNKTLAISLTKEFQNLGSQQKAPDKNLQAIFLDIASRQLFKHNSLIRKLNTYMPDTEKLLEIEIPASKLELPQYAVLSQDQVKILVQESSRLTGYKGIRVQVYKYLVRMIPKYIRKKIVNQRFRTKAKIIK